jgi:hypothetical protein
MKIINLWSNKMIIMKKVVLALATAGVLSSGAAQAALNDRGGGLLYDDVLNVTWLQDANYAKTSGYDADGQMDWNAATAWAANLVYHDSVRNVDLSGWRLASNTPINGVSFNVFESTVGSSDIGFNITSPNAELSYMFYVNLGLKGYYSSEGLYQPGYAGIFGDGTSGGQNNVGIVTNFQSGSYWSGTENADFDPTAWVFHTSNGRQVNNFYKFNGFLYSWAVRPGDVAAVPEPETYALMLAGLGLIGLVLRRKQKLAA